MGEKFIMNNGHGTAATTMSAGRSAALNVQDTTNFRYMFRENADGDPIIDGSDQLLPVDDTAAIRDRLMRLGDEMGKADDSQEFSGIPPVYTYWGQFIDHDVTANTDRENMVSMIKGDFQPLQRDHVEENLKNRDPALGLDSLYGDGPQDGSTANQFEMYESDGVRFRIGSVAEVPAQFINATAAPANDLNRDLPRDVNLTLPNPGNIERPEIRAAIGDHRNDENLIVAQFHLAWLRFHNAVADWVETNENLSGAELFIRSRDLVRWHYQWLVVHDYLKTICANGVVDRILHGGLDHFVLSEGQVTMPLEFSVAAFRFGHTMVREEYDFNANFSNLESTPIGPATFDEIFLFTGGALPRDQALRGFNVLPRNWIIDWDRFVNHTSAHGDRFARPIDTHLAPALSNMANADGEPAAIFKNLARRNLLRGYLLSMPTGQAVASILGVTALSDNEMLQNASPETSAILQEDNGLFLERTPLWHYILKEAEVQSQGRSLGEVGSTIVAETLLGLIANDRDSYLNGGISDSWEPGDQIRWSPANGVKQANGAPIVTVADMLSFAGVYVP